MSNSQEVVKLRSETTAGVNSRFAVKWQEEILEILIFLMCCFVTQFAYANTIILFNPSE